MKTVIALDLFMLLTLLCTSLSGQQINRGVDSTKTEIVLPPAWAFGVLYGGYTNQKETVSRIQQIIDHDYPIDGYWIDSWFWDYQNEGKGPSGYLDFIGDTIAYPNMESMWKFMKEEKIKSGIWIWDCVIEEGNEVIFQEAYHEAKNKENPVGFFKDIIINKSQWHNGGEVDVPGKLKIGRALGNFDFENPNAVKYFQNKLKPFFDKGLDFLKLDRSASIPFCRTTFEATQQLGLETKGRGFILAHSGNPSSEYLKYPAKWTDDTKIAWSHPAKKWPRGGLKENIEFVTVPGKKGYGIPFTSCDIGGYSYGGDPAPEKEDDELFIRWSQFGAFLPIMEVFTARNTPSNSLAWRLSERAHEAFKKISHFRMQLFPYIYTNAHKSRLEKRSMIASDGEHFYQYLFGNDILVGPVVTKGARKKKLYLPQGKWINYYTNEIYEGGCDVFVDAPLDQIPLMIRSGAIIPMRGYARSIEQGSNKKLELLVYPDERSTFTLYEDDGISNAYLSDGIAKTQFQCNRINDEIIFKISKIVGAYKPVYEKREVVIRILLQGKPKVVALNGEKIYFDSQITPEKNSWRFLKEKGIAEIHISYRLDESQNISIKL